MMWCDRRKSYWLIFKMKSLFEPGTILETIMKLYSHDLLCDNFFEMIQHDGRQ